MDTNGLGTFEWNEIKQDSIALYHRNKHTGAFYTGVQVIKESDLGYDVSLWGCFVVKLPCLADANLVGERLAIAANYAYNHDMDKLRILRK